MQIAWIWYNVTRKKMSIALAYTYGYQMNQNRRDFISTVASAVAFGGCSSVGSFVGKPEPSFVWSCLVHFGYNSWNDTPIEKQDKTKIKPSLIDDYCTDHVRFSEKSWHRISAALAKAGCNQIVIDLAEFVRYPSHPELAVKGSWSVEKLRTELDRLRGMGFEVIPKMNFSATHDTWLKDYHRMVSTKKYYQVCEDLIKDVVGIFDHPRFFHLGYDEECYDYQRKHLFAVCRQGDLWWHDFLWFVKVTEKEGCRPWIWSDYSWKHRDEFIKRMPRGVLQSNWYYGAEFDVANMKESCRHYVQMYEDLDKAGFDQVPTGSNWSCDTNFDGLVKFCDAHCSKERIKGYMMAPWLATLEKYEAKTLEAVEQMSAAIKARKT